MVSASTGSLNPEQRDDRVAVDTLRSADRSRRRGRTGSVGDNADRPATPQICATIPDRSAKGVRSGSAPAQHRAPDTGESLWWSLPVGAAAARPDDEGPWGEARW